MGFSKKMDEHLCLDNIFMKRKKREHIYDEAVEILKKMLQTDDELLIDDVLEIFILIFESETKVLYVDYLIRCLSRQYYGLNFGLIENTEAMVYLQHYGTTYVYDQGDIFTLDWIDYSKYVPSKSGYYFVKVYCTQVRALYYDADLESFMEFIDGKQVKALYDHNILAWSTLIGALPIDLEQHLSQLNYDWLS